MWTVWGNMTAQLITIEDIHLECKFWWNIILDSVWYSNRVEPYYTIKKYWDIYIYYSYYNGFQRFDNAEHSLLHSK